MEGADSFMNWGFNPKQGSNKKPYYLIYGGANPEEGDPYAGFIQFETLQSALKAMWEVWDSFESWKMDDVMEWIHEEGQGLILYQGGLIGAQFPEALYLTNKYPGIGAWAPPGVTQKEILPNIDTPIVGLTHTSGWLGEGETGSQFVKRVKNEYETNIDKSPTIKEYANKLESIPFSELVNPRRPSMWHQFYLILEMKYSADWNMETMKVVYAP